MKAPGTGLWHTEARPRRKPAHRCESVKFIHGWPADSALIECVCGWAGVLSQWPQHHPGLSVSLARRDGFYWGTRAVMPGTRVVW